MFADNDSIAVNSHIIYEILNDPLELFKPECKAFEADHAGLQASAINCSNFFYKFYINQYLNIYHYKMCFQTELLFIRSGILWQSPYCIRLRAFDSTVDFIKSNTTKSVRQYKNIISSLIN